MIKKNEEKTQKENTHKRWCCHLDTDTRGPAFHKHHLVAPGSSGWNSSVIILSRAHHCPGARLGIFHACSLLCLAALHHSRCEIEVHVEKTSYCMKLYNTCENSSIWFAHSVMFLQVSSKIPHRQGFCPHQVWASA